MATDFKRSFTAPPRTTDPELWTLNRILLATRGRILPLAKAGHKRHPTSLHGLAELKTIHFAGISTDSRTISPGDLFIALSGDNFNGVDFIHKAIQKGAAGVVVRKNAGQEAARLVNETKSSANHRTIPIILVENTEVALGDLAAYRRSLMGGLRVIAITGSSGKTTVKEMTAAILADHFNTLKTKKNFNNLIGLPLTLLDVTSRHDVAVLEMGMNRPGEIFRLTDIADPDIGVINNVHPAHLEGLGSIEGVAKAKQELFEGMKSWSTLVVNYDDPIIRKMAGGYRQKKISYAASAAGRRQGAYIRATHARNHGQEGLSFTLHIGQQKERILLKTIGSHNIGNALAATALTYAAGLSITDIAEGLSRFTGFENRAELLMSSYLGLHILNDSYNANPASTQAALESIAGLKKNHQAIAVLGDMFELGNYSIEAHRQVGKSVAKAGLTYLAATGEFAAETVKAARAAGMPVECTQIFRDKKEISRWLQDLRQTRSITNGDWLLLKGSRGMHMETILTDLAQGATD